MNPWDVTTTLEWTAPAEADLVAILRALPEGSSVGRSAWSDRLTVGVSVFAATVTEAGAVGAALARHALASHVGDVPDVVAVEVFTEDEAELRAADPPALELLSVEEAASVIGVTPARVRQMAAAGDLGAIKVGTSWVFRRGLVQSAAARRAEKV